MGADACRMTLEALNEIAEFEVEEFEDFLLLKGTTEFEDKERHETQLNSMVV